MNSAGRTSPSEVTDVLAYLRSKGVKLWSRNGELHYRAPKGALSHEEIERLRSSTAEIVAILERKDRGAAAEPPLTPRQQFGTAPLTFSQWVHWRVRRLDECPTIRQLAAAVRLCGRLDVNRLQISLAEVVRRHDALRTRCVILDGTPAQEIAASGNSDLGLDDLTVFPENTREVEVQALIDQFVLEPINVAVDPLFVVRLAKLRDDEHVLIVAMEHMISDAYSLGIFFRDIFAVYVAMLKGDAPLLRSIPIQFPDYAVWQRKAHEWWIERHSAYWRTRLRGCGRLSFPSLAQTGGHSGWGTIPIEIGRDLKTRLHEWCRLRRTTLVMGVLTAYVGVVLRWCGAPEAVIRYETDGRVDRKVADAIGYFAAALHLRVELRADDNFAELMNRITAEYCNAHEHADFSFLEAQEPPPDFAYNTLFNWVPQGPTFELSELNGSEFAVSATMMAFANPVLKTLDADREPTILLYESENWIAGGIHFPLSRFSVEIMERFGRNFMHFVEEVLSRPDMRVSHVSLL